MSEVTPARALAIELKSLWVDAKHGRVAKLTANQVLEIRSAYEHGATQTQLAGIYGVSHTAIGDIIRGKWQS